MKFPNKDDGFRFLPCRFGGIDCVLITPTDIKTKFTEENKYFRSSIWTLNGEPVSLSYRKFVNYGEALNFEPFDINDPNITFTRKIDGSLLCVSRTFGELIIRTRGTTDARQMNNGDEIDFLINKYSKAFDNDWLKNGYSCIYEWTTPSNIIVLRESKEPELWLTGIIKHEDYSYVQQEVLDKVAIEFGVKRPESFKFNSFQEMINTVSAFKGKEGVVAYSGDGQTLKKIKSISYLAMHRMKSHLNSNENVVDYYLANDCTSTESLMKKITEDSDYEISKMIGSVAVKINQVYHNAIEWLDNTYTYVETMKSFTRKEQAQKILDFNKKRSGFMFMMLDNKIKKPWNKDVIKKIMMESF